jgi:hypothetical protein
MERTTDARPAIGLTSDGANGGRTSRGEANENRGCLSKQVARMAHLPHDVTVTIQQVALEPIEISHEEDK